MRGIDKAALMASSMLVLTVATPVRAQATSTSSGTASADSQSSGLADIVVTATKTGAQNLQQTPIAISVVDDKLLEGQGLSTVKDFAKYVPNLVFTQNAGAAIIYIRGIGSSNTAVGSDPSVTQQIDGVYIARATAQLGDFIDVERVEVLRGPQGTLYGRNSVGGTINIISRQPSAELGGEIRVGYGNYDTKSVEAYLTGPIASDTLTGSIAVTHREHDEFFHNVVAGVPGTGAIDRTGVRAQLRWRASPDLDFTLRGDVSRARDRIEVVDHLVQPTPYSPVANSLIGGYRDIAINIAQPLRLNTRGTSLDANYDLGNGFMLKSITAYRHMDTHYAGDGDGTEAPVLTTIIDERDNQFTQELNLSYKSDRLRAVGGVFFFGDNDVGNSNSQQPPSVLTPAAASNQPNAHYRVKTRSYAAFGQIDFNFTEQLSALVGLRYTTEKKSFDQNFTRTSLNPATLGVSTPGFPIIFGDTRHDHALTPKFGLNFQLNPDVLIYASATRGFKAGGYNNAATAAATAGFNPEKVWAYEAGTKTQFFDKKLRLNLSGFIYDYTDLQVRQLVGNGTAVISNAATAKIKGVELEAAFKPIPILQFSGNVSYLDANYKNFAASPAVPAFAPFIPGLFACSGGRCYDASDKRIVGSPRWSSVAAVDFTPSLGNGYRLSVHADYDWRGLAYYDASNVPISAQRSYSLVNANLSLEAPAGWRIEAYINNATNKKFFQNLQGAATTIAGVVGDPRTYGVRLGYKF